MNRFTILVGWMGVLGLALVVSTGCPQSATTGPTAHLQGTVTLAGAPIPADATATITFSPLDSDSNAVPASSPIKDGKYDVPDAPLGKVRVNLSINRLTGKMAAPGGEGRPEPEVQSFVTRSWWEGQEIQVEGDNPSLNFDVK
jgi:hypothetical protein